MLPRHIATEWPSVLEDLGDGSRLKLDETTKDTRQTQDIYGSMRRVR